MFEHTTSIYDVLSLSLFLSSLSLSHRLISHLDRDLSLSLLLLLLLHLFLLPLLLLLLLHLHLSLFLSFPPNPVTSFQSDSSGRVS